MLGSSKAGAVRAVAAGNSARSRDADLYRRYAAGLYRQALLTRGDPALPEHVGYDVIVNERALARMPERGEAQAYGRLSPPVRALWHAVMRRGTSMSRTAVADPLKSRRK
jgi:hypothetical protein